MLRRFCGEWRSRYGAFLITRGVKTRTKRQGIPPLKPYKPPLAVKKPLEEWDIYSEEELEGDFIPTRKCKSLLKKKGRWSLHMARILSTFSTLNLKNAIKWACLPDECYECVKTLQRMEAIGVLVGKRRQYTYLAGLLRNAEPTVVEFILHSLENEEPAIKRIGNIRDEEMEKTTQELANKWYTGLLNGNENIYNDVHAIEYEMFDREELRWLIRLVNGRVYMRDQLKRTDKLWKERAELAQRAETQLRNFLLDLARRDYSGKAYAKAQEEEQRTGISKPFVLQWK